MLKTFSVTDIGKKRNINQDYVFTQENPVGNLANLFIVADGMGGHNAGDYASKTTVETIVGSIAEDRETEPVRILGNAIQKANEMVYMKARECPEYEGMGTTVVAASLCNEVLSIANVGDSRLYVISNKEIKQITRDHSYVEEMVRMGSLAKDEARNHPDKNIITRAVGVDERVVPDFFSIKLSQGDTVLMCSDGLTNMVEDEEIRMIVAEARDIVEEAVNLVEAANRNGGKDNISVVLIEPFA